MVSKRISELPAAGALDGTEQIPLTQDGETRRISGDTYRKADVIDLVRDHGAPTDETSDAYDAIKAALDEARNSDRLVKVVGPPLTFKVDPSPGPLELGSLTELDLQGGTLQRIGTDISTRLLQNAYYGGFGSADSRDQRIAVRRTKLVGTGSTEGSHEDGHLLAIWGADGIDLDVVETDDANGDGILWRDVTGMRPRHIRVGSFGRNGMSPTSGESHWYDVEVTGEPHDDAVAPKKRIDVEPNSGESARMFMRAVRATQMELFDNETAAGGDFLIEADIDQCDFYDGFPAGLRILCNNPAIAQRIYIGPNNYFGGNNGIVIDNVSGVEANSPELHADSSYTNPNGVQLENQAHDLRLLAPKFSGAPDREILCNTGATADGLLVTDADMALARLIGSNCRFQGCDITEIEISESSSTGNVFDIDTPVGTVTLLNSALKSDQVFRHEDYRRVLPVDLGNPHAWHDARGSPTFGTYTSPTGSQVLDRQSVQLLADGTAEGVALPFFIPSTAPSWQLKVYWVYSGTSTGDVQMKAWIPSTAAQGQGDDFNNETTNEILNQTITDPGQDILQTMTGSSQGPTGLLSLHLATWGNGSLSSGEAIHVIGAEIVSA